MIKDCWLILGAQQTIILSGLKSTGWSKLKSLEILLLCKKSSNIGPQDELQTRLFIYFYVIVYLFILQHFDDFGLSVRLWAHHETKRYFMYIAYLFFEIYVLNRLLSKSRKIISDCYQLFGKVMCQWLRVECIERVSGHVATPVKVIS